MNRNLQLGSLLLIIAFLGSWFYWGGSPPETPDALGGLQLAHADEEERSTPGALSEANTTQSPAQERVALREETTATRAKKAKSEEKQPAPTGPFLTGIVLDPFGSPLPDVEVTVKGEAGAGAIKLSAFSKNATTNRRGEFKVSRGGWPAFPVRVSLVMRGFELFETDARPERATGNSSLGEFQLRAAVILAGTVMNSEGAPVVKATVWREDPDLPGNTPVIFQIAKGQGKYGRGSTETDDEGRFELPHEPAGDYVMRVSHGDYPDGSFPGTSPPVGSADLHLNLQLEPGAVIAGRVEGMPNRLSGVSIQASPLVNEDTDPPPAGIMGVLGNTGTSKLKAVPRADGSFTIKGLRAGRKYKVQAWVKQGLVSNIPCSDSQQAMAGATDVHLSWAKSASITFRVEDAATGKPLNGGTARYRWTDSNQGLLTNARRKMDFDGSQASIKELRPSPSPATLELVVFSDGYLAETVGKLTIRQFEQTDLGTLRLSACPKFRVQVLDAASGDPIKKARVVLYPQSEAKSDMFSLGGKPATGKTDKQGWCELDMRSSELATLAVRKRGLAPFELKDIPMSTLSDLTETVRLVKGSRVTVQVTNSRGQPAAGIQVTHRTPEGKDEQRESDRKGQVRYKDLEVGEHKFRASAKVARKRRPRARVRVREQEEQQDWQAVSLNSGSETLVELQLPATGRVNGRVTRHADPVPHAKVSFMDKPEPTEEGEARAEMEERIAGFSGRVSEAVTTDAQGRFTLLDLPLGKHSLRVKLNDGSPSHYEPVEIFESDLHVDIELPGSAVRGLVEDTEGKAIMGATLTLRRVEKEQGTDGATDLEALEMVREFFGNGDGNKARTDARGQYTIHGIPEGSLLAVEARATGYVRTVSSSFKANPDSSVKAETIRLQRAGSIRVTGKGRLVGVQAVYANRVDKQAPGPSTAIALGQKGVAIFKDLTPGEWIVSFTQNPGDGDSQATASVTPGVQTQVALDE